MTKKIFTCLLGWAIIAGILYGNKLLFDHFLNINYFKWFLKHGSLIGIVTGLVYLFRKELKNDFGLISDHPLDFLGAQMQVLGILFTSMGDGLRGGRISRFQNLHDLIITLVIIIPLAIILIAWFLIVIPCQYVLYLICGAPSRLFKTSEVKTKVTVIHPAETEIKTAKNYSFVLDIKEKPFEFTNAISALILFIVSQIVF